ncbi:MAG TPA: PspC domain-containing protein [Myxococcus sp.]|jgi:phage shock protein PspC (stress-responsive transcriptional regulator)|nr:PspC domain-containing protein [Myxococcus sp.]
MDAMKRCTDCAEEMKLEATRCPHCGVRTERLHRGVEGRMVGGVCAGLARQFGVDPALLRVAFVVSLAISGGTATLVYLMLWGLTPASAVGVPPFQRLMDWVSSFGSEKDPEVERRV